MTGPAEGQGRLPLDGDASEAVDQAAAEPPAGRVVRVLPDVAAIDRTFDYLVPAAWEEDGRAELVRVGSQVRVVLAGRRVGGWVVRTTSSRRPACRSDPSRTSEAWDPTAT